MVTVDTSFEQGPLNPLYIGADCKIVLRIGVQSVNGRSWYVDELGILVRAQAWLSS